MDSETEKGKNRDELLAELEVYQLELEMQNEQLSFSYEMLDNERSKFADFFDLAPVGYFVLDPEGKVQEANQTGVELFGTAKNKLLFKDFKFFIADESRDSWYVFMKQMKSSLGKRTCEVKIIHEDYSVLYLRLEGLKVKHKFNESFQYYVTAIDITTTNLAQQRLMDTKQRLEMTLRASGTGTWVMELDQRKLTFDDYCLSILELDNLTFDEDIRSFIGTIHPDDQQSMSEALRAATSDFEPLDLEFRIVTKRGIIKNIAVKGHRVVNVSANYFAGILVDITEKKRQIKDDLDIRQDQQRLVLSATFDAQEKERFRISNALHDSVCQILYGIRLNLQGISISSDKKKELNNATMLLDEAIKETRMISYELTPSVLRDFGFAAGVKEMVQRLSSKRLMIYAHVDITVEGLHKEVQLYLFRMVQELVNNCLNHSKATEGRITVTTDAGEVILNISDNGKGFSGSKEQLLLKGSGLRAIKNRVFLLGGSMDIESSLEGTTVLLRFKGNQNIVNSL